jgi:hypothetical protein
VFTPARVGLEDRGRGDGQLPGPRGDRRHVRALYDVGEVETKAIGDDDATTRRRRRRRADEGGAGEWTKDPVRGKYGGARWRCRSWCSSPCACQCAATLADHQARDEELAVAAFTFAYMTALAYVGALVTFQVGRLIVG